MKKWKHGTYLTTVTNLLSVEGGLAHEWSESKTPIVLGSGYKEVKQGLLDLPSWFLNSLEKTNTRKVGKKNIVSGNNRLYKEKQVGTRCETTCYFRQGGQERSSMRKWYLRGDLNCELNKSQVTWRCSGRGFTGRRKAFEAQGIASTGMEGENKG